MITITNLRLFNQAEDAYKGLNLAYSLIKKTKKQKKSIENFVPVFMINILAKRAFEIPIDIRQLKGDYGFPEFPGFNDKLKYLFDNGFLLLEDNEINMFDPVTSDRFYQRIFKKLLD